MRSRAIIVATVLVLPAALASFIDIGVDYDTWRTDELSEAKENISDTELPWDSSKSSYFFGPDNDDEPTRSSEEGANGDSHNKSSSLSPDMEMTTPYPHKHSNHRHFHHRKSDNESSILAPGNMSTVFPSLSFSQQ
jgi:hypothetical protein